MNWDKFVVSFGETYWEIYGTGFFVADGKLVIQGGSYGCIAVFKEWDSIIRDELNRFE